MDSVITEKHIPIVAAPNDQLRCGVRSFQNEAIQRHPVEIQQVHADKDWNSKLDTVRRIHGSALAMRLAGERQMFSESHRIPGLKSSKIALETLMGEESSIHFSDFLNDPSSRPEKLRVPLHDQMEVKFSM